MAFDPTTPGKRTTSQARLIYELLDHAGRTKRWSGSKLTHSGHLALSLLLELARKEPAVYAEFDCNNVSNEDLQRARLELHLRNRGVHGYTPEQLTALEFLLFLTQFAPNFEYRKFVKSEWSDVDNFFVVKGPIPIPRSPPKANPNSSTTSAPTTTAASTATTATTNTANTTNANTTNANTTTTPTTNAAATADSNSAPAMRATQHPAMRADFQANPALLMLANHARNSQQAPVRSQLHFDQSSLYAHYPVLDLVQLVIHKEPQQSESQFSQPSWWH